MKSPTIAIRVAAQVFGILLGISLPATAQLPGHIPLEPPGDREFILDKAGLINASDEERIREIADALLTEKAAPIVVVTIDSMNQYGGGGLRIETFARLLFDQWGIGPATVNDASWNHGILLLVSRDDRVARIELGAGWRHDQDDTAQQVMNELIIPRFKQGDFSGGILAGVEGLDKMARGLELPRKPTSLITWLIGAVVVGLLIFTAVSTIRRGMNGWAWIFWTAVFSFIGLVLLELAKGRSGGSGGSYSGGSFGGGFSGGGGATGSW